ncbi:hypothetical protein LCGC14_1186160 [marine sediment metagenome]|uniref:Uncharacterized protein n=1 Tax=marine sediment metagenome TaxID=412755 RepID=A0A0F9P3I0_9ZZZZ
MLLVMLLDLNNIKKLIFIFLNSIDLIMNGQKINIKINPFFYPFILFC